jgi:branched-chain amino acid transport system permease protein
MSLIVAQLENAAVLAAIYALLAVGLNFIYAVTRIVQLAQGDLMALGGYVGVLVSRDVHDLPVAVLAGTIGVGVFGVVIGEVIFARLPTRNHMPLVAGVALSIALEEGMRLLFYQGTPISYGADVAGANGRLGLRLILIGFAIVLGVGFEAYLRFTRSGRALRATADDSGVARLMGVSTRRMRILSFGLGSALAGGGGALLVAYFGYVNPTVGQGLEFIAIAAVLLGSLGSMVGALVGSCVMALAYVAASTYISSSYANTLVFAVVLVVVVWRPQGLFGHVRGVRA